jgi:outer membrane protein TolC
MKMQLQRTLMLLLVLLAGAAGAQALTNLQDALTLAVENAAPVTSARHALETAQRTRERTLADPLALRLETLRTEHAVNNSEAALRSAILAAQAEALGAYADVLAAENDLQAATLGLETASMTHSAAGIRFKAGAITQLDLGRAANDQTAAERRLAAANSTLELARSNLASLSGLAEIGQLEPLTEPAAIAPLDEVLLQLQHNAQLQQAEQAVATASLELAASDNPLSSQAQIESARSALQNAEAELASLQRSLSLSVRQAYNAVLSARSTYDNAVARVSTAREMLAAQQLRFDAGLISQLDLLQAELDLVNASGQNISALQSLLSAGQSLQRTVAGSSR